MVMSNNQYDCIDFAAVNILYGKQIFLNEQSSSNPERFSWDLITTHHIPTQHTHSPPVAAVSVHA